MIKYEYMHDGKLYRHIYFIRELNFAEFLENIDSCDELCISYAGTLDEKIEKDYGKILVYISKGADWRARSYSLCVNLQKDADEILHGFRKNRKYEVKRARDRDGVKIAFDESPSEETLKQIQIFYNGFAESKNMNTFDFDKYASTVAANILLLAIAYAEDGELLVVHGYLLDREEKRPTLSFSASHFRDDKEKSALVGRANGYLHYASMCYLKEKGFGEYDFGGIYVGEDRELSNISDFKKSFGGELREYAPKIVFQKWAYRMVEGNLSKLRDIVRDKNIILWGMATWGKYIVRRLRELYDVTPVCMIDTALSASHPEISKPDALERYSSSENYLIVTTDIRPYKMICKNDAVKPFLKENSILCIKEESL